MDKDKKLLRLVALPVEPLERNPGVMNYNRKAGLGNQVGATAKSAPNRKRRRQDYPEEVSHHYMNEQNMGLLARLLEGKNATLVVLLIVVLGGGYLINENNKALLELSVSIKALVERERDKVSRDYVPKSQSENEMNKK